MFDEPVNVLHQHTSVFYAVFYQSMYACMQRAACMNKGRHADILVRYFRTSKLDILVPADILVR